MITSTFSKSRVINYIFITFLFLSFFTIYTFLTNFNTISSKEILIKALIVLPLVFSFFITNFITKKNGLSKDNSYTFFLLFLFFIFFPDIFPSEKFILSNVFILLALRRLISLNTLVKVKEKIFDASLWILIASLFNFWAILFILLVFIAIIQNSSKDFKNWIIPFVALVVVFVLTLFCALLFENALIFDYLNKIEIDYRFLKYGFLKFNVILYLIISCLGLISTFTLLSDKLSNSLISYRKIIFAFLIGICIFILSPDKEFNLIYTFVPVSIMFTNLFESIKKYWIKETVLVLLILICVANFIYQILLKNDQLIDLSRILYI